MKKIPDPYLKDITDSIEIINDYLSSVDNSKERFVEELQIQDAIIRRLEIIGEAAKRLEANFKEKYPAIPWRKMAGLRDVLIHDYDEIDLELVWEVVVRDLPELKLAITHLSID